MANIKERAPHTGKEGLLYFTSDHLAFFDRNRANKHAERLEDKTIREVTKNEAEAQIAQLHAVTGTEDLDTFLDELTEQYVC